MINSEVFKNIADLADTIFNEFEKWFKRPTLQMLIDRSNKNTRGGSKRWVSKLISLNANDARENIEKLLFQMYSFGNQDIRLYSSLNARNMEKAIAVFKHRQIDVGDDKEFYKNINSKFVSCLMSPENRDAERKHYLLDIDTKNEQEIYKIQKILRDNDIFCAQIYGTPHGYHFIADPFDVRLFADFPLVSVHKDGLLLLHTLSGSH